MTKMLSDEAIKNLKVNVKKMQSALKTIEKGLDSNQSINQFRSADIIVKLALSFESTIDFQRMTIENLFYMLKTEYGLDISCDNLH